MEFGFFQGTKNHQKIIFSVFSIYYISCAFFFLSGSLMLHYVFSVFSSSTAAEVFGLWGTLLWTPLSRERSESENKKNARSKRETISSKKKKRFIVFPSKLQIYQKTWKTKILRETLCYVKEEKKMWEIVWKLPWLSVKKKSLPLPLTTVVEEAQLLTSSWKYKLV